ncbi:MAG: TRAP transporter small permease subunit [Dehalococcoidales bacterium]|nr:TRAP transporter small permease subunit [Dehalococcoidales bacterium]
MFEKFVRFKNRWENTIANLLLLISGILILLIAVFQTYGVFMRYALNSPQAATYEFSAMFLLFCGVLAVAGVEKLRLNVKNDLISSRFPYRFKLILSSTLFPIMAMVFCSLLIWKSWENAVYALQIGQISQSAMALPLGPIKLVVPICYSFLFIVLIGEIVEGIYEMRKNSGEHSGQSKTSEIKSD